MAEPSNRSAGGGSRGLKVALTLSLAVNIAAAAAAAATILHNRTVPDSTVAARMRQQERESQLAALPKREVDVLMLGDSLTERGEWAELLSDRRVANRGIDGETVVQIRERVPGLAALAPKVVFVLAGTNDLADGREIPTIGVEYGELIDVLKKELPSSRIVVQSVPPPRQSPRPRAWSPGIPALNKRLEALSTSKGVEFLDLYALVVDDSAQLCDACTVDGLHFTGEAYRRWTEAVSSLLAHGS